MFHHRAHRPAEDEESGLKSINAPSHLIRHAQIVSHPEPIRWYAPSRTELAEMREAVAHCGRCGGSVVASECILCGHEVE